MSDDTISRDDESSPLVRSLRGVFTPQARSLAAAVLAFVTLTGNSILVAGLQSVLGQGVGADVGPFGYLMSQAVAGVLMVGLVVLLARAGLRQGAGWEATAARAALIVAGLALLGSLLVLVGGLLTNGGVLPL